MYTHTNNDNKGGKRKLWEVMGTFVALLLSRYTLVLKLIELYTLNVYSFLHVIILL